MNLRTCSHSSRPAFTLVELLVVIAIIGVLVAFLLPSLSSARNAARKVVCASNLRQFGIALSYYDNDYNALPPGRWNVPNCIATIDLDPANPARKSHQVMREDYKIAQKQTICPSFQGWNVGAYDNQWNENDNVAQLTYTWMMGNGNRGVSTSHLKISNVDTGWISSTFPNAASGFYPAQWLKRGISLQPSRHPLMFDVNYLNRPQGSMPNTANHLGANGLPEGANYLFIDGHAEFFRVQIGESWELMNTNHFWSPNFEKPAAAANIMTTYNN